MSFPPVGGGGGSAAKTERGVAKPNIIERMVTMATTNWMLLWYLIFSSPFTKVIKDYSTEKC